MNHNEVPPINVKLINVPLSPPAGLLEFSLNNGWKLIFYSWLTTFTIRLRLKRKLSGLNGALCKKKI